MKRSMLGFLMDQFVPVPPLVDVDLTGKTVVIVGANAGLGFATAKHLARMGPARVILGCRDQGRGDRAVQRIKEENSRCAAIEMWLVDLGDFASTIAFADRFARDLKRLDLLVLNAAVAQHTDLTYTATKDGFEHALQINNIAQSLIALRALPLLYQTAETFSTVPRIVVVGSEVHHLGYIPEEVFHHPNAFRVLGSREYCSGFSVRLRRYFDTKLLNLFFVRGLSARLKSPKVIVNTVNPGMCSTELRRDVKGFAASILGLYERIFARNTDEGGRLIVWACVGVAEDEETLHGAYINLNKVEEPGDIVLGEQGKKREEKLWDGLVDALVDVDPQIKDVIRPWLL